MGFWPLIITWSLDSKRYATTPCKMARQNTINTTYSYCFAFLFSDKKMKRKPSINHIRLELCIIIEIKSFDVCGIRAFKKNQYWYFWIDKYICQYCIDAIFIVNTKANNLHQSHCDRIHYTQHKSSISLNIFAVVVRRSWGRNFINRTCSNTIVDTR